MRGRGHTPSTHQPVSACNRRRKPNRPCHRHHRPVPCRQFRLGVCRTSLKIVAPAAAGAASMHYYAYGNQTTHPRRHRAVGFLFFLRRRALRSPLHPPAPIWTSGMLRRAPLPAMATSPTGTPAAPCLAAPGRCWALAAAALAGASPRPSGFRLDVLIVY